MKQPIFYRKSDAVPSGRPLVSDAALSEQLHVLIRESFGPGPVSSQVLGGGTFHQIFSVDLAQQSWVIKVGLFSEQRYSLATEAHVYGHVLPILSLGLRVYRTDLTCTLFSFPYLILEKAEGRRLRDEHLDDPLFPKVVEKLGRKLGMLHTLPAPTAGWGVIDHDTFYETGNLTGSAPSWRDFIEANLESHVREAYDNHALDARTRDFVLMLFARRRDCHTDTCCRSLLHGDIGSHNIFFALDRGKPRMTAVIDWEDALVGDPVFDVASFASFFRMHQFLGAFLRGYREVSTTWDDDFEERLWTYYVRILLAKALQNRRLSRDKPEASVYAPRIAMAVENLRRFV
jgi:aminoglycoside phosphotransferase (APT) family kinase protein